MRLSSQNCGLAALVLLTLSGAYPLRAQGLGDVARKEEERRKDIKAPAKVYTNKDLGALPDSPSGTFSSPAATGPAAPVQPSTDTSSPKSDDAKDKSGSTKGQAYWSGRKKELQSRLDSDQTLADALQSRINALNTDFVNRDDPVQRAGIDRDRQKASSELDRLKKSVQDGKKALADLDEEARRAGVPAGWLR
jgi:hypothetical protein